jgi:putative endonuclease
MKSGYVYIMASDKMGTIYIGSTSELVSRVIQHKMKTFHNGFTAKYNVENLVYYEYFDDVADMVIRERQLKEWRRNWNWKLKLIIQQNPEWRDLYDDIRGVMPSAETLRNACLRCSGSRPSPG